MMTDNEKRFVYRLQNSILLLQKSVQELQSKVVRLEKQQKNQPIAKIAIKGFSQD